MKEIRDAVGWAKAEVELLYGYDDVLNKNTKEMLNILIDLAEKVLAIGGKMPEKEWCIGISNHAHKKPSIECKECAYWEGRNDGIDQCVLAFAGMGLSEEELENIMWNMDCLCEDCGGQGYIGYATNGKKISCEKCGGDEDALGKGVNFKGIATAIHSAQMEKLGGE